jgi:PAS domain S-box-containing protein
VVGDARAGRASIVEDSATGPENADRYPGTLKAIGVRAQISVPLHRSGVWSANFWVASDRARRWSEDERDLVVAVAHRLWSAVEDVRAAKELRQLEEATRANQAHLAGIVESAMDAIVSFNADRRIVSFNPAAERMFGYRRGEVVGRPLSPLLPESERLAQAEHIRGSAGTGAPSRSMGAPGAIHGVRAGGEEFPIEASISRVTLEGETLFTVILRDVTQRERAERSLRGMAASLQEANAQVLQYATGLEDKVRERTAELCRVNARLQNALEERLRLNADSESLRRQLSNAHEEERRRIARELHDRTGQRVVALGLGLEALKKAAGPNEAVDRMVRPLETLVSQTGLDLQRAAAELRQPALEDLGRASAVRSHLRDWSNRTGIAADFEHRGYDDVPIAEEIDTALYRFVQEALDNAAKHAGATLVCVILARYGEGVQAVVEDNGHGFDVEATLGGLASSGRLGILGVQERLRLVGGSLDIESTDRGTTLYARAPNGNA